VHQEPSTLCSRCSTIYVKGLFVDAVGKPTATKLINLGELGVEAELSSCSLCRLFHAVRIQDDDNSPIDGYDNSPIEGYDIAPVKDYFLYLIDPPPRMYRWDRPVLAVVKEKWTSRLPTGAIYHYIHDMGLSRGFIAASKMDPFVYSVRALSIDAMSVDFNIIRGWIHRCAEDHKLYCTQGETSALWPAKMKLIDCERRKIVSAQPSYTYSALSYVWGTSRSDDGDRCVHNELPATLPRTVADALKVTKELGLRYIWIDRYCINQKEDDEKQVQIRQMDLIYQKAFVTIIAAAGTDPHFGLPGVSATSRSPQPTAWVNGRCHVSTLTSPRLLINASKWMRRAWTYQESYFSTRRIVFTEQQVLYECRSGIAYETVDTFQENGVYYLLNQPAFGKDDHSNICQLLEEYCGRELSVDSDAIRAFEGVFHNYRRRHHVHQYLGIPIMPLQTEISLENRHRSRGEAFAAGLTWCNKAPGTRRSLFPTWSWAGWTAPINYKGRLCWRGLELGNERPLKVFVESCDGSLWDMDELSDVSLDWGVLGSSGKFIHIEAWTIPVDVQCMPNRAEEFRYHKYWYEDGSGYLARFQGDERVVKIPMHSLYQKHGNGVPTQQSCAPDFEQHSLLGIVLGRCEDLSDLVPANVIFIMVVQEKEYYYERVGHILFAMECPPGFEGHIPIDESAERELQTIFRSKKRRTIRLG
jgi:hypothetical protein